MALGVNNTSTDSLLTQWENLFGVNANLSEISEADLQKYRIEGITNAMTTPGIDSTATRDTDSNRLLKTAERHFGKKILVEDQGTPEKGDDVTTIFPAYRMSTFENVQYNLRPEYFIKEVNADGDPVTYYNTVNTYHKNEYNNISARPNSQVYEGRLATMEANPTNGRSSLIPVATTLSE